MQKILIFLGAVLLSPPVSADNPDNPLEVCVYYANELYAMNIAGASYEGIEHYIASQENDFIKDGKDIYTLNKLLWRVYSVYGRTLILNSMFKNEPNLGFATKEHDGLLVLEKDLCPEWADEFPKAIKTKF